MAELDQEQLEEIIRRTHPDAEVVERQDYEAIPGLDEPTAAPDVSPVDLDALREKYLDEGADVDSGIAPDDLEDPAQQMADVRYRTEDGTPAVKTVIVSSEDEEIIGEQG